MSIFLHAFVLRVSLLMGHLLKFMDHFNWVVFLILFLIFMNNLTVLGKSSLFDVHFINISSQSVACFLILSELFFLEKKFLIIKKSNLSIICFVYYTFCLYLKAHCHTQGHLTSLLYVTF